MSKLSEKRWSPDSDKLKNAEQLGIRFTLPCILWKNSYELDIWRDILICSAEENRGKNIMQPDEMLDQNSDSKIDIGYHNRIFRFKEL